MADMITFKLEGLDEYIKRAEKLSKDLMQEAVGLIWSTTGLTAREARKNALSSKDTGALIRSIIWRTKQRGLIGTIFVKAKYGIFVEFGTSNPNYPRQPFLGPAFDNGSIWLESELKRITKRV